VRKVVANEWMSLDGVVQSAGSDDDTTGGFEHGGWHLPYLEEVSQRRLVEHEITPKGVILATYARNRG
jgi:hypothetical protein